MFRTAFGLFVAALVLAPLTADEPKEKKPTVELGGSIDDEALQKLAPANGVIASQKAWDELAKAWSITDAPKVDFTKELLLVGTWKGSVFNLRPTLKDGDLSLGAGGTKDLRPGFRWKAQTFPREGVKTVQGKELPKE
jgi:hypothetical protein